MQPGLAIDPRRSYNAENVVPTRVWHGDLLDAECEALRGQSIIEEEDLESTRWFRVRLPREKARSQAEAGVAAGVEAGSGVRAEARATAWLPAVRTKNRPALPRCPHPAPASAPAPAP
ncbi:hypothetical protein [Streptomyces zaomyceticus]|uniref:hypothetical protein n=1 Tax=Streptomyces zaomyceticus TaxID=68286 RepID=UPI00386D1944